MKNTPLFVETLDEIMEYLKNLEKDTQQTISNIHSCIAAQLHGRFYPEIDESVEDFLDSQNVVYEITNTEFRVKLKDLYKAYNKWAAEHCVKCNKPVSKKEFSRNLDIAEFESIKRRGKTTYLGIALVQ